MTPAPQSHAPRDVSLADAYDRIRRWYQANVDKVSSHDADYRHRSIALIRALPPSDSISPLEIRAVFEEVLTGLLEWGYRLSDLEFTMAEYAKAALEAAGLPIYLSEDDEGELRKSALWPLLTRAHRASTQAARPSTRAQEGSAAPAPENAAASEAPAEPEQATAPPRPVPPLPPAAILHSDLWADKDALGFSLYAKTIAEFIDQAQTKPPLTVAILAPWGRGKTTLMRLVREELARKANAHVAPTPSPPPAGPTATFGMLREWLRRAVDVKPEKLAYPTVWFNAWKFQSSEQVWAGLAHEIISQLVEQVPSPVEREKFWLTLQLRRLDTAAVLRDIRGAAFERIAGQLLSWATLGILVLAVGVIGLLLAVAASQPSLTASGAALSAAGGTVASLLIQVYRAHSAIKKKPLEGAYAKYVRQPDYAGKRGTLAEVEEDIRVVFDVLVNQDRPAVVFIDDLDRCSPGKVAEVMEAVNLFLSGDFPNCYFVIGMDAQVVAASMDVAHKELTEKLAFVARGYGSLGWYFMDKFIQLPFVLPSLTETQRTDFLGRLFQQAQRPTPAGDTLAGQAQQAIRALGASQQATSDLVQKAAQVIAPLHHEDPERARKIAEQALEIGAKRFRDEDPEIVGQLGRYAEFLGPAPRTIKRFANLYRFYRMVQWSRELQGLDTAPPSALGRWLTLMLRWPQLVRWIQWEGEAHLFLQATDPERRATEFENGILVATSHSDWLGQHGLKDIPWCADAQLFDFLRATPDAEGRLTQAVDQGVW